MSEIEQKYTLIGRHSFNVRTGCKLDPATCGYSKDLIFAGFRIATICSLPDENGVAVPRIDCGVKNRIGFRK